jgi:hypothetical protein
MKDIIERKNILLKETAEIFRKVRGIADMCDGIEFTTTEAATQFMTLLSHKLREISYQQFDLCHEANISLPEAEEGLTDEEMDELDDFFAPVTEEENDRWNPGVVPPTEEEMAKMREEVGDD